MRTRLSIGGCMAVAIEIFAGPGSAGAQPPEAMTYMEIATPLIACDTRDQMAQVVEAISGGKLEEKMIELAGVKNSDGESVCVYSPLPPLLFGESEHVGRVEDHERGLDIWITHVGNKNKKFYILWGEEVKETLV